MEWKELIEQRHTTFAWEQHKIPSKELIVDALEEVYEHVFSKNLQFPYQVRLWRNNNKERRRQLFAICHRNSSLDIDKDPGNPQVLAPYLLIFNARYVADREVRFDPKSPRAALDGFGAGKKRSEGKDSSKQAKLENMEIGIFTAYITLALANKGIQTGVCQNITCDRELAESLFPFDHDERALDLRFVIGLGYGKDRTKNHRYFDPRINRLKNIPYITHDTAIVYKKPKFEEIIKIDNE